MSDGTSRVPGAYRIGIVRKGQPTDRRPDLTVEEVRATVYEVIAAEGQTPTEADHAGIDNMISKAQHLANMDGFGALEIGTATVTIRSNRSVGD